MKTAEQILKYSGLQMTDFISSSGYMAAVSAMKAYAKDAIDRCAESAKTKNQGYDYNGNDVIVDKQSILNVKSELK